MAISDLLKEIHDQRPFVKEDYLKNIFSWQELENLLNLRPFISVKRFFILNDKEYNWPIHGWLSDINTFPSSLIDEEIQNNLCYLADCSRVNSKVNAICGDLEKVTNGAADAHIYFDLSVSGFIPLQVHWDKSHNFIVQIEGQTKWKVWDIKVDKDGPSRTSRLTEISCLDVMMNPGDVIFIPAYHWHYAQSETKRLSISFPFSTKYEDKEDRHWIKL